MDPDMNLVEQLAIAEHLQSCEAEPGECYDSNHDPDRLAELVLALNGWIHRGGFLPTAWNKGGKSC